MSKRGLSFDEKKFRMLQLFHEKKQFFQLKELEKIAPKEKGITANSVKEVIQALVDDEAIDTDKIGGSIYFWSFQSKVINSKKRKLEEVQNRLESSSKNLKIVQKKIQEAKVGKENVENSSVIMEQIGKLQERKEILTKRVQELRDNNPQKIYELKSQTQPLKDAANRWTDNIFAVKSWCKKKFMIEEKTLNKQFAIPSDLDYIE